MNLVATFAGLSLLCLAITLALSMELPDKGRDMQTGLWSLTNRHKLSVEAATRFWLIKKLAGDSSIMLNVRVRPSEDSLFHIDDFSKGSLIDRVSVDGPLALSLCPSNSLNTEK